MNKRVIIRSRPEAAGIYELVVIPAQPEKMVWQSIFPAKTIEDFVNYEDFAFDSPEHIDEWIKMKNLPVLSGDRKLLNAGPTQYEFLETDLNNEG